MTEETVPILTLIQQLNDANHDRQQTAAIRLIELGKYALPAVTQALRVGAPQVRYLCAWILGQIGDPRSVPALTAALNDEDERVLDWAARGLGEIGDTRAVVALTTLLRDHPRPETRRHAAQALGWIGTPDVNAPLRKALGDTDDTVRGCAAECLGHLGDTSALHALQKLSRDESAWARVRAIYALARLQDESVFDSLYQALRDPSDWVRFHAATGLGELKARRACADLMHMVRHDPSMQVRRACALALAQIGEEVAIETLVSALADLSDIVREAVDNALQTLGYTVD